MPNVHNNLSELFTGIADAIRSKTGSGDPIVADEFPAAIASIAAGGSTDEWIGDGNTHIWISLAEGRTSPMLGVGVKGTVTVDWGDGSAPDTLKGSNVSSSRYTPVHNYAKAGDYVITLSGDGQVGIVGSSNGSHLLVASDDAYDKTSYAYRNTIKKVEIGNGVTSIGAHAFYNCSSLASINIPDGITSIGTYAFSSCRSIASIDIPDSVTSIGSYAFHNCVSLSSIVIPDGVTSIDANSFHYCYSLSSIVIPDSVTSIGTYAFDNCYALSSIDIPNGVTSIGTYAFDNCVSLSSIVIPDGVTSIGKNTFSYCYSLTCLSFPSGVTSIGSKAFQYGYSVAYYDFSNHTAVPTLSATDAFLSIPSDCQIRVPAALVDEWKAATNWATYADYIVGV